MFFDIFKPFVEAKADKKRLLVHTQNGIYGQGTPHWMKGPNEGFSL